MYGDLKAPNSVISRRIAAFAAVRQRREDLWLDLGAHHHGL